MSHPAFSIIITTVDRPRMLRDAVSSVLSQTFSDFEVIIVNDGGPDVGEAIMRSDPLARVRTIRLPGQSGPGGARNRGIENATGEYVCFLDDDDLFYPDHLQTLAQALERHPQALVYADAVVCNEHIEADGTRRTDARASPWQHEFFLRQRLWMHNFIPIQAYAVRRDALIAVGGFDKDLRAYEDWDLLLKLAVGTEFIHIPRVTSEVRLRPKNGGHRSLVVRSDRSESSIIEALYARHGDLDDPLVRAGRAFLKNNGYSRGPDFLVVDLDDADIAYRRWRETHCTHESPPAAAIADSLRLIVTVPQGHDSWLGATLLSATSLMTSVRITVVAAAPPSGMSATETISYAAADPDNLGATAAVIAGVIDAAAENWVAIVPAGTTLAPNIAVLLATARQQNPAVKAVYFDHDSVLLPQGIHAKHSAKPDFDPELLVGTDYIGPALCMDRNSAARLGIAGALPAEAIFFEMLWRIHDQFGDSLIIHVAYPAVHLPLGWQPSPLSFPARQAVLEQRFQRLGNRVEMQAGPVPGSLRIIPTERPPRRISIILWGDADVASALRCAESIASSAFDGLLELLPVCNAAELVSTALPPRPGLTIRLLAESAKNSSTKKGVAAQEAGGEVIVFLRDTVEFIAPSSLQELVFHAARENAGAVSCKLVGDDGLINGGAFTLQSGKLPAIAFCGTRFDANGESGRLQLSQTADAVTDHCLAIRRTTFLAAGGFDATAFPGACADIELCIRLARNGLRNFWLPQIAIANHGTQAMTDDSDALERLRERLPDSLGKFSEGSAKPSSETIPATDTPLDITGPTPPLVSVLFWSDNASGSLPQALDALLVQTYQRYEIVVLDNASTDDSNRILELYARQYADRLRIVHLPESMPRMLAERQYAAQVAGSFVAFASPSSISAPNRLLASVEELLSTPNLGAVCSKVAYADKRATAECSALAAFNEGDAILRRRVPKEGNVVAIDSVMLRRELFLSFTPNPAFIDAGHLQLWLHVLDDAEMLRINEVWLRDVATKSATEDAAELSTAISSVGAIIAALRRWGPERIFRFTSPAGTPARQIESAVAEAQLAMQLIELDRRFFGRPALGCHEAFHHAALANALAPHCIEAQQALRVVRNCLGEIPGQCLDDWRAQPPLPLPASTVPAEMAAARDYQQWQRKHSLRDIDGTYLAEHVVHHWQQRPVFIVIEVPGPATDLSARTADQLYPPHRVLVATAGSTLAGLAHENAPVPAGGPCWLLLLPNGARPKAEALIRIGDAIAHSPNVALWYADDEISGAETGMPLPRFKPDPDLLLLQTVDYLGAIALRADTVGEFPANASPAALALALAAGRGREALGHVPEVLFALATTPPPMPPAVALPGTRSVWPGVTLIVVVPPDAPSPAAAVEGLLAGTDYPAAQVAIVCDATAAAALPSLPVVARRPGETLAEAVNAVAATATSEYLLLVGADSRPTRVDWLRALVAQAEDGDYAAVGAAGIDSNEDRRWDAGVVVGIGGGFDGLHGKRRPQTDEDGHLGRAAHAHECSALRADGLLLHRQRLLAAGGLDARWLHCSAIVADACLRLREAGHRLAWTPAATLRRDAPDMAEATLPLTALVEARNAFVCRWRRALGNDPYWNRHLSLQTPEAETETDLVLRWTPEFRDRLRVLALPMPASGQAEYRVTAPLRALDNAGLAQTILACEPLPERERAPTPAELERLAPDVIYLQAAFDDVRFNGILACAHFNPEIFRIFSLDDRVSDMPAYNASSKGLPRDLVVGRMREALRHCNRLVVSTEPLAECYRAEIDDIVVVPNRLEKTRWQDLDAPRRESARPRVGWAGALQHAGDLAIIREVVAELADEVDWVFFGMIPAGCEAHVREFHAAVHLDDYPAKLASLTLDLALAPLEINLFNESKSNLRLLEYGILGWPVICTDIFPYRENDAPVCRLPNDPRRWTAAIRERLANRDALRAEGDELRRWVRRHYLLEDHLDDWLAALRP